VRSIPLVAFLLLSAQEKASPRPDLDLGRGIEVLAPVPASIPREALARVAEHVGRPPSELEGAQLFTGSIRVRGGTEQPCGIVWMPLVAPVRGGHLVSAVADGKLLAITIAGALDLDEDPSGRWGVFVQQLLAQWGGDERRVALADEPTRSIEQRLSNIRTSEDARLARALLAQRMAMRDNSSLGILVGQRLLPRVEWLRSLEAEMAHVAELAPDLAPLIGAEDAKRHAERATELANVYADFRSLLEGEPDADTATLAPDLRELDQRRNASCRSCHESDRSAESPRERFVERRRSLDLYRTLLRVGYDVSPALGDDGKASTEIVDKVRASVLLVEAARNTAGTAGKPR
jgi:hypothetical protein